jgi:hypothetical protein
MNQKIVPIVPTDLIFNLNDTGWADQENWMSKPVLVPTAEEDSAFHYPTNKSIPGPLVLRPHFGRLVRSHLHYTRCWSKKAFSIAYQHGVNYFNSPKLTVMFSGIRIPIRHK